MTTPRISASSYSNTAPLVWSFLYGRQHGNVEVILDNAPARSAQLLAESRVDAALVPVITYQMLEGVRIIPDVCVGAKEKVRSVCLVTRGQNLTDVRSVALDVSSRTSVVLTKIIFREFLGFEPEWRNASPDIDAMLADSDAALIIGDPALILSSPPYEGEVATASAGGMVLSDAFRTFDLAQLWHQHTNLGFIFAMWMTRRESIDIDFAAARDEGLAHIDDIAANYCSQIGLTRGEMNAYLTENISFTPEDSMREGMELYFQLAAKQGLIAAAREPVYL